MRAIAIAVAVFLSSASYCAADPRHAPPINGPQFAPRSEVQSKLDTLRSDLKQSIDQKQVAEEQKLRAINQSVEALQLQLQALSLRVAGAESEKPPPYLPLYGALMSAVIGGAVAWWLAHSITLWLKKIESTLEFSKRYGELMAEQSKLNRNFAESAVKTKSSAPTDIEAREAMAWWWRYFDLMLYEYDFFKQGLVWKERFAQWMKWRWHESRATGADVLQTNGIEYSQAWRLWKMRRPNENNRLGKFLDIIHGAGSPEDVEQIVELHAPRMWSRYHLD